MMAFSNLKSFLKEGRGAAAAEFAIVSLIVISILLGILDMARFAWEFNSQKAAARAGARYAAVHAPAVSELVDLNAIVVPCNLAGGQVLKTGTIADFSCTSTSCAATCPTNTNGLSCSCLAAGSLSGANFDAIVSYMREYNPRISAQNVIVDYRERGLGVAGNPYGTDTSPLITVSLRDLTFSPMALRVFGVTLNYPSVATTLSAEDMS